MNVPEEVLSTAPWYTSSHSGDASNCVQVVAIEASDQGA